jgi:PAS domain S-box-containing protein
MDFVINQLTQEKIYKSKPVNEEVVFDGGVMITETDKSGMITYANRRFIEMTGFTKEELIGSPHCINRHPDMPKGAFRGMWEKISSKKLWNGYVKNLRKDGKFYWVHVFVKPKLNIEGEVVGYIAARKAVMSETLKEIESRYIELHDSKYINHHFFECADIELIEEELESQQLLSCG